MAEAIGWRIETSNNKLVPCRFKGQHLRIAERLGDDGEAGKKIGKHGGKLEN